MAPAAAPVTTASSTRGAGRPAAESSGVRLRRHVGTATGGEPGVRAPSGRRELVLALTAVVAASAVVQGPAVWAVAVLALGGALLGTLQLLGAADGPNAERGVPIESLLLPAVAALGTVGAIRLMPLGLAVVPALFLVGFLLDRAIAIETRLAEVQTPSPEDRVRTMATTLVVAFIAFAGIAAAVPNGLAAALPGAPLVPLPIGDLALLAGADALVAGLLGYRSAALRDATASGAFWAAVTAAVAVALGAAALRAMGIPRLIGPALLALLFYLWDSLHAAPPTRRRDPRWIWETAALVGLGALVAFWNVRLIG
jgi:hypothetical protein